MSTTDTASHLPTQHCDTCNAGPFFYVAARTFPTLCLDCADDVDRKHNGWTVTNSVD